MAVQYAGVGRRVVNKRDGRTGEIKRIFSRDANGTTVLVLWNDDTTEYINSRHLKNV